MLCLGVLFNGWFDLTVALIVLILLVVGLCMVALICWLV